MCWIKVKNVFYKKIDVKECNTAKGVSIAIEFNKFKDVLFDKNIIRHKIRRIIEELEELTKYFFML